MTKASTVSLIGIGILLLPFACGGGGGGGGSGSITTDGGALCATPCFAWQYCDPTTNACVGNVCSYRPIMVPGKTGTPPDPAECSPIASCDFSKNETDAFGHAIGRCTVIPCVHDSDCDDGVYCNGAEICSGASKSNPRGCAAGTYPCSVAMACVETTRACTCTGATPDVDSDGHVGSECGGDDCDDGDPNRYPGNKEICDAAGHDEDCDPTTLGAAMGSFEQLADADGDGFAKNTCCNIQPNGSNLCGTDCDDTRATISPAAVETCNYVDDDCDGMIDEGVSINGYLDNDRDGYGKVGSAATVICPDKLGLGYSVYANDCDDTNPAVVPGALRCEPNPTQATAWPVSICSSTGTWTASTCEKGLTCTTQPTMVGVCW